MRSVFVLTALFVIAGAPVLALAQTASPRLAPVDEYFGQSSESVLEIRNRLTAVESKSDADARAAGGIADIDYFEEAVLDWQQKYPRDSWVAGVLSRTVQCYARAGAAKSERATAVLAVLTKTYPKSPEADRALLAMWNAPAPANAAGVASEQGVVSGSVVMHRRGGRFRAQSSWWRQTTSRATSLPRLLPRPVPTGRKHRGRTAARLRLRRVSRNGARGGRQGSSRRYPARNSLRRNSRSKSA